MKDKKNQNLISLTYKIGEVADDYLTISSYSDTFVKIQNTKFILPICIIGNDIFQWKDKNYLNISVEKLKEIFIESKVFINGEPEIILLGLTKGKISNMLDLKKKSMAEKLPFEIMKHDAACRTINILTMEGRKIIAILI